MKRSALLAGLIGLALVAVLLASNDLRAIGGALRAAGWGILLVVALHLPQTLFSALGWGPLVEPRLHAVLLFRLRFVREGVNALLPVAQIGGDLVRARLAQRRGVPLRVGVAASLVDVSVEMVAQILFTLLGLALLLAGPHGAAAVRLAVGAVAVSAAIALAFVAVQRGGLFRLIERAVGRWASHERSQELAGLHDTVAALYRRPGALAASGAFHLCSWLLGVVETLAALHALGIPATLREATVIEALGQVVRAFGFLVPGALGIQEGGYLMICALFGIAAPQALALALIRRIRELALGLPGLALWHRMERGSRRPMTGAMP